MAPYKVFYETASGFHNIVVCFTAIPTNKLIDVTSFTGALENIVNDILILNFLRDDMIRISRRWYNL